MIRCKLYLSRNALRTSSSQIILAPATLNLLCWQTNHLPGPLVFRQVIGWRVCLAGSSTCPKWLDSNFFERWLLVTHKTYLWTNWNIQHLVTSRALRNSWQWKGVLYCCSVISFVNFQAFYVSICVNHFPWFQNWTSGNKWHTMALSASFLQDVLLGEKHFV